MSKRFRVKFSVQGPEKRQKSRNSGLRRTIAAACLFLLFVGTASCAFAQSESSVGVEPIRPNSVRAEILPWSASEKVPTLLRPEKKDRLIGLAVVRLTTESGWHLYSPAQKKKPGGFPTEITVEPAAIAGKTMTVGRFLPASPVEYVRNEYLDEVYEQMAGEILFAAPLYLPSDGAIPAASEIPPLAGRLAVFACSDETCAERTFPLSFTVQTDAERGPILAAMTENAVIAAEPNPAAPKQSEAAAETASDSASASTDEAVEPASIQPAGRGFSSILWNLFKAFLGGMVLNIMPCVLPVIGLKIVSFFEQAGQSRSRAFRLNGWYSAGILSVFAVLALMSVGLSHLFTYGLFQIVMGGIVFVMALNLMGVWEIALPSFLGGKKSNELMRKEGRLGAFFKGVITTLLAIPCGAPLLSAALVWADSLIKQGQTLFVLLIYLFIGLGMSFPYLTLGAFPELLRFLPKPGLWMETFRNVMGFILLTAVIWILFSMPISLVLPTVAFLFALWFACWFVGSLPFDASPRKRRFRHAAAAATVLLTVFFSYNIRLGGFENPYTLENASRGKMIHWAIRAERSGELEQKHWRLFDRAFFDAELAAGHVVLLDFTADWCMNCKALESTVLHTEAIESLAERKGIVTMTADLTNRDAPESAAAFALLDRFGGRQVPVVMIFSPENPDDPTILRGLFTRARLESALEKFPAASR